MARKSTKSNNKPKTTSKKSASTKTDTAPIQTVTTTSSKNVDQSRLTKIGLLTGLVIILAALGFWLARNVLVVAMVNGQPLSRLAVINELENTYGSEVVNRMVTEMLIQQEAAKQNITVNQTDVDAELATISASLSQQGRDLDQVLMSENMTRDDLINQIKLRLMVNQLSQSGQAEVSQEEIEQFLKDNAAFLPEGLNKEEQAAEAKKQLQESKASEKVQEWLQSLQTSANIEYLLDY